jgi:hypothetical protein
MKKLAAILMAALALAGAAFADQITRPVIADATTGVIVWPNPTALCNSNQIVRTDDALYAFITNDTLVAAATGTVESVATLEATITNIPAASVTSGNIAQARITNALATAGALVLGNIPVASITNAAGSVGASIGGNIPVAALTNALATNLGTVDYTNVIVSADAKTNTIIVINGLVTSWVVTE